MYLRYGLVAEERGRRERPKRRVSRRSAMVSAHGISNAAVSSQVVTTIERSISDLMAAASVNWLPDLILMTCMATYQNLLLLWSYMSVRTKQWNVSPHCVCSTESNKAANCFFSLDTKKVRGRSFSNHNAVANPRSR